MLKQNERDNCSGKQFLIWSRGRSRKPTKEGRKMRRIVFAVSSILILMEGAMSAAPVEVIGITEPYEEVTVSAPVSGIVTVKNLKEGDFVQVGTVILELDKKMEELELDRRKLVVDLKLSDLESTRRLFKTTKGTSKEELEKKEMEY